MSGSMIRVTDSAGIDAPAALEPPSAPARINSEILRTVRVMLEAKLGSSGMTVEEMMALRPGAVVTLETSLADHVELCLNGTVVARGEIVAVGEKYGVRIVEIAQKP